MFEVEEGADEHRGGGRRGEAVVLEALLPLAPVRVVARNALESSEVEVMAKWFSEGARL